MDQDFVVDRDWAALVVALAAVSAAGGLVLVVAVVGPAAAADLVAAAPVGIGDFIWIKNGLKNT